MKYNPVKPSGTKYKKIKLDCGIWDNESDMPDGDYLEDAENVYLKNGVIVTRKGVCTKSDSIFGSNNADGNLRKNFTVNDTDIFYLNKRQKIGYTLWGNGQSTEIMSIFVLDKEGTVRSLGNINFSNNNPQNFYTVESAFFIQGKARAHSGIFLFVKSGNYYNSQRTLKYEIYEYNNNNNLWVNPAESDYYTPTVYINGRGDKYLLAKSEGSVFDGAPMCPEEINLLGGKFYAYFSSDGYSSGFKLPFSNLKSGNKIICKIYSDSASFTEWEIGTSAISATATFMGKTVKLSCDRASGYFNFTFNNADFPIPNTGKTGGNDICFFSVKDTGDSLEKIVSSTGAVSHNARIYLYGNDIQKNEIFSAKPENPLYFPLGMSVKAGSETDYITALKSDGKNLLAFKNDGIYRIYSSFNYARYTFTTPVGLEYDFTSPDKVTSHPYSEAFGEVLKNTVINCGKSIFFMSADKKIYSLTGDRLKNVTGGIAKAVRYLSDEELNNAFSLYFEGNYVIVSGNKAYILCDENCWYKFILPDNSGYSGSYCFDDIIYLICNDTENTYNFLSVLDGEKDICFKEGFDGNLTTAENKIDFSVTLSKNNFGIPDCKKDFKRLNLSLSGNGFIEIEMGGNYGSTKQHFSLKPQCSSDVGINPFILPSESVFIKIKGNSPFALKNMSIEYLKLQRFL